MKIYGSLKVSRMLAVYIPIIVLTPLYSYYMAVIVQKNQKKFPSPTVTSTACHYPQDIVFRYTMISAASMLALTFFIMFRWLQYQVNRVKYKMLSKWYYYLTMFSILMYLGAVGTIDEKTTGPLHGPCAVIFFVILMVSLLKITLYLTQLREWDTTVIGKNSLLLKQILASYIALVWTYCLIMLLTDSSALEGKGDKYIVIVQWNSVLINLLWVLAFIPQWWKMKLSFTKSNASQ